MKFCLYNHYSLLKNRQIITAAIRYNFNPLVIAESSPKYTPLLVGVKGFQVDPAPDIANVLNEPLLLVISPEAVILVIPHNELLSIIIGL